MQLPEQMAFRCCPSRDEGSLRWMRGLLMSISSTDAPYARCPHDVRFTPKAGAIYGKAAQGYIEAHHLIPLSEIPEGQSVELNPEKHFAVLCANCHRTIHRKGAPKDVAELRELPGIIKLRALMNR